MLVQKTFFGERVSNSNFWANLVLIKNFIGIPVTVV